nr:RNA-directed DNA polymerase, eukaryota [Tanacetum cinerariifolium]
MIFKVDFAKAYDSIRWDFLDDVLISFGFGSKWRSWIHGSLSSGKASILVHGSPTTEFHFHRGLKQGDPFSSLSVFTHHGVSPLIFFPGCRSGNFHRFQGMSINIQKSHLLGIGILDNCVAKAAKSIGCSIMKAPFKYL